MGKESTDKRFVRYWSDPEKVRERNRAYYYRVRGLPVPEKKEYKLRKAETLTSLMDARMKALEEKTAALAAREAELDEREERLKKIEQSYTLKSYTPTYIPPSKEKKAPVPAAVVPPPPAVVSFVVGKKDFA